MNGRTVGIFVNVCHIVDGGVFIKRGSTVCVHRPSLIARPVGTWE